MSEPRVFDRRPTAVRLDELPRRAARTWPGRPAVDDGRRALTFAGLDALVDRYARAVRAAVGGPDAVVGSTTALSTDFAALYYGVSRSGNVMVSVNPFLLEAGLEHVLRASATRLLFVTAQQFPALAAVRDRLPDLAHVVWMEPGPEDGGAVPAPPGVQSLADFLTAGHGTGLPDRASLPDVDAPAALHFTSGTTGPPKAVVLSHRNLTVNAAQIAHAHRLTPRTVALNHLPLYHLMHLNSAVHAGAAQVLCQADDPAEAVAAANRCRATRYFTIPVRLFRLAADPRLPSLRLRTVEAVYSGGTALPARLAQGLQEHFGVPFLQGYGLAETSPVTHTPSPDDPCPGSVGPPVAGTECRIADVDTGREAAPGALGEVQVRGPQVMSGYLDPALPTGIDSAGWLSTGDVGRIDTEGRLHLVDRLKDVFKNDHWLVSPSSVEQALLTHPDVADCVVVDHPDGRGNSVPYAFVVPRTAGTDLSAVAEQVNRALPYYEHIRYIDAVTAVPRSGSGKPLRRQARAWAAARD